VRAIVTGSTGTVGTALAHALRAAGGEVVPWDRRVVPIDDYAAMRAFVGDTRPDALFHLAAASQPTQPHGAHEESWAVNYTWTSELAWLTRELDVAFVFTSTVMVFTDATPGPYTVGSRPDATHDYGMQKRRAEQRAFEQNPAARIARLGWQIGADPSGNHMAAWLAQRGTVQASLRWLPACSLLDDTARALLRIACMRPGLYHVDANEGWSFHDIACALRARHDADWIIEPAWDHVHDQRLLDPRLRLPPLAERLPALRDV
jgi:dTDP-4-dehydrorhamnose reductase